MDMIKKIAVVGATGNAGGEALKILVERNFPAKEIVAIASEKSVGKELICGNTKLIVQDLNGYDFRDTEIALFAVSGNVSDVYGKKAASEGCIVVDKSSFYRMDKDIPLVIPEVNGGEIAKYKNRNIIASPNCSTTQMVMALKPLHDIAKIKRVVVSTYQAVSGAGKNAVDELYNHTESYFNNDKKTPIPENFKKSITFNVIPQIDVAMGDGYSGEEDKMIRETKKILGEAIEVTATCVRVPVFNGHSESLNVEFEKNITPEEAREILTKSDGVSVVDDFQNYIFATPTEYSGKDQVFVSRIRKDFSIKNALNMWVVGDNIRKGAALNAVQIAEILVNKYLISQIPSELI
jgi:aspartate-semialdehyde dehydrogenase